MPRLYVTGGRQRSSVLRTREEWTAYEAAVLLELDTDTGAVRTCLEYTSPPGRRPERDPSHVFKAGSVDGEQLLLCTQTEVVVLDKHSAEVQRTISHPWFNDVHHVCRIDGRLNVVSTGLDALLEVEEDGTLLAAHSAVEAPVAERFSAEVDYRLVPTTKPHAAHPNYVCSWQGERWLTRFVQRDARSLTGRRVGLAEAPVHDGVVHDEQLWFTVVAGEVVVVSGETLEVTARYDLNRITGGERALGWCRGLHHHEGLVYLGFSRLRPTKLKQNLSWLRAPLGKAPEPRPTRVGAYDLAAGRLVADWSLEEAGISSIFSILPSE